MSTRGTVYNRSGGIFSDPVNDRLLGTRTAHAGDGFSLLENEQCRYAAYGKPGGNGWAFLGIYLYDRRFSGKLPGNVPHHRCEVAAVGSPGCPEFGKHRTFIIGNE